jgi:tetratricopeptide (TPR) repeat protein
VSPGKRAWIGLAIAAAAVLSVDTAGWWWWLRARATAPENPGALAAKLAGGRAIAWPPVVERTRRLALRDFGEVPREVLAPMLGRIGSLQARWMPAHPVGAANLARSALLSGDVVEAEQQLAAALLRDPSLPGLRRLRALTLLADGRVEPALAELAIAEAIAPGLRSPPVDLTPGQEAGVRMRGLELRDSFYPRRRVDNALALAGELRRLGLDLEARQVLAPLAAAPAVQLELAQWSIDDGDPAPARQHLEALLAKPPAARGQRARCWSLLAVARDLEGDAAGALAAAQEALRLDPGSPYPYLALATLAERRGDAPTALAHLRRAWGMAPGDVRLLTRIARVAERADRGSDAALALARALELEPDSAPLAASLVSLQLRQGRFAEAASTLARALDRHPTDPALLQLAQRLRSEVGPG